MFSDDLSIDLGTANTLIFQKGTGLVLNEPSVVALRREPRRVLAVGAEAKNMLGRNPDTIQVIRPMKEGQVADFEITNTMLSHFIKKANQNRYLPSYPRVIICIPSNSTEIEKRTIKQSAKSAGAREVFLIEEPLAAAVGAGLPIQEAGGNMVVDIGGGTTDVAILSLGGVVTSESIRIAGDEFDKNIISYIRNKEGCLIGEITAERIKCEIGTAVGLPADQQMELTIQGQDLSSGKPTRFTLNSNDLFIALNDSVSKIIESVLRCLERTLEQLAAEIAERGMVLTGGGALLSGLDQVIREETGIPVLIASDPLKCVAEGCGKILNDGNAPNYEV